MSTLILMVEKPGNTEAATVVEERHEERPTTHIHKLLLLMRDHAVSPRPGVWSVVTQNNMQYR